MKQDLQRMYGATPDSFKQSVASALKQTEVQPMKKYATRTLVLAAALVLMLMAAAYAAFSSQVAEFFGHLYGQDMKTWLEQGEVASTPQSYTLDNVLFTLDEVVYRDNGLYGVGTIRPKEGSNDVLLPDEYTPDLPFGYDVFGEGGKPQQAPAGTPTLAEKAREKGGKLKYVRTSPDTVSVDGGPALSPSVIGSSAVPLSDGSIRYSFEMTDALSIPKGSTYTLSMWVSVWEMDEQGNLKEEARSQQHWQAALQPVPMETTAAQPVEPSIQQAAQGQAAKGGSDIITPEEYQKTGTLPLYAATERDFGKQIDPAWFNASGIATRDTYKVVFNDGAILDWAPEALFYGEYDGTFNTLAVDNPDAPPQYAPWGALSKEAASLASSHLYDMTQEGLPLITQNTQLEKVSLKQAQQQVESLMQKLDMQGYLCDAALDMTAERIQTLAKERQDKIASGKLKTNIPARDVSQITADDEGYYLTYHKPGAAQGSDSSATHSISAFVGPRGIASLTMRDMFIQGDVLRTPDTLVSPESVVDKLPGDIAASRFPGKVQAIQSVRLTYGPMQDKGNVVFTPLWLVLYQDEDAARNGFTCWAEYNAVDGSLMNAIFK